MKIMLKLISIFSIFFLIFFLIYQAKYSENTLILAQYEMLACENCNHMYVINSSNKKLVKQTIIPISSKNKIKEIVESAIEDERRMVCMEGRLYFVKFYLNMIDPGGTRFYVDELKNMNSCDEINQYSHSQR